MMMAANHIINLNGMLVHSYMYMYAKILIKQDAGFLF